mmetsp:Transcript_21809/g.62105  ORF Transcript_21809/g.62105 Transcript_21809/m.62105 type:complete len:234 (+) Transcript_21809:547-1248(+)
MSPLMRCNVPTFLMPQWYRFLVTMEVDPTMHSNAMRFMKISSMHSAVALVMCFMQYIGLFSLTNSSSPSSSSSSCSYFNISSSNSSWNVSDLPNVVRPFLMLGSVVFFSSRCFSSSSPVRFGSTKVATTRKKNTAQHIAMKYPGPVIPLKCCLPSNGSENSNGLMESKMIAMPGPIADPSAVINAKAALAIVRRENGVASATYRRLIILGAPTPEMARPSRHSSMLLNEYALA